MPETAENVADEFGVAREAQDAFALRSQERAAKAIATGRLAREIGRWHAAVAGEPVVVDTDEHPRETSLAALADCARSSLAAASLPGTRPASTTGRRPCWSPPSGRQKYGLTPLARVTAATAAGVEPRIMGMGPEPARPQAAGPERALRGRHRPGRAERGVRRTALGVLRELGLPDDAEHVNPNGGAIALGHPLGASGARLALTAAIELPTGAAPRPGHHVRRSRAGHFRPSRIRLSTATLFSTWSRP